MPKQMVAPGINGAPLIPANTNAPTRSVCCLTSLEQNYANSSHVVNTAAITSCEQSGTVNSTACRHVAGWRPASVASAVGVCRYTVRSRHDWQHSKAPRRQPQPLRAGTHHIITGGHEPKANKTLRTRQQPNRSALSHTSSRRWVATLPAVCFARSNAARTRHIQ